MVPPTNIFLKKHISTQVKKKFKKKLGLNNHFIRTSEKVLVTKLNFLYGYKKFQPDLNMLPQKQNRKSYQNKLKLY